MVNEKMYNQIQKLKRQGYNKSKIARTLKIDRKTVTKYINMSANRYRKYQQDMMYRDKAFDSFKQEIFDVYKQNGYKKLNIVALFDYLEEKLTFLPCTEKTLRNYVSYLIETGELTLQTNSRTYTKVPQLPYGKQVQLDFGEITTPAGLKIYIFSTLLSASRYKYVALQDTPFTTESTIHHILDAFDYFGGMPEQLVIDQDRVMVVAENHGDVIYTKAFKDFIKEMNLNMYVCKKADPESKGKVENLVKYVKYNFFNVRDFSDIETAKDRLSTWLFRRANGKISQATKRIPAELIIEERKALRPLKNSIYRKYSLIDREPRKVDDNSYILYASSSYSVPVKYRNMKVEIYTANGNILIFDRITGNQIAEHEISLTPGAVVKNPDHFRSKAESAKELKDKVHQLFSIEQWQLFVTTNFKQYHRYIRDQCSLALRHFSDEIDEEVLHQALTFCHENKSYTFSKLEDAYQYYLNEKNIASIQPDLSPETATEMNQYREVKVHTRSMDTYNEVLVNNEKMEKQA